MPTPVTLPSSRSHPHHTIESRPTPTTSLEAGHLLEGTGAVQEELKLRGAIEGRRSRSPYRFRDHHLRPLSPPSLLEAEEIQP
ncbi:hypothetical protein RRG08_060713 [Elysia crispata]|uniref:Uncharacterized protein n=1 Tax=Elysia crispata TaxID=231223 RepID=A0AAE0YKI2_9GAST|nr:hypothetical protein RRG08_060713 [Elysia crispata]